MPEKFLEKSRKKFQKQRKSQKNIRMPENAKKLKCQKKSENPQKNS